MADSTLTDPLGRAIVLHGHTWYGHIAKRHPEMRGLRSFVEKAVEQPIRICFSTSDANCRLYYGPGPAAGMMVAVVADVAAGLVKTAYRAARVKGTPEWSPPTP